uniref:Uncharacterized protein n=1 Tax=Arundo donax TaxID=35708 RepID=A0A0A9FNF9_ARUDO
MHLSLLSPPFAIDRSRSRERKREA